MAKRKSLWKAVGEMASALREEAQSIMGVVSNSGGYSLETSHVDYNLARQLYYNTHENYKLGAGFAKPIINSTVGFMGAPTFRCEDENGQVILDSHFNKWTGKFIKLQRNWLREGDVYVMLVRADTTENEAYKTLYKNEAFRIEMRFIPPERVTAVVDPHNSDRLLKIIIRTDVQYKDENNEDVKYTAIEVWTPEQHTITYDGDNIPEELQPIEEANPWKFIPIWWLRNENEEHELHGRSELEPVEPYIRAYHDVMMHALRTSKLTSTPKLKLKLSDFEEFIKNNFSEEEIRNKKLKMANKDVIFVGDADDAGYVQVSATNHETLLEFLFMCIVDVSETPEFAFGTAVASSKASVSEQMVPLAKKVERKRSQIEDDYRMLGRMLFAMYDNSPGGEIGTVENYEVEIDWVDIDATDDKAVADTVKTVVEALVQAVDSSLISYEAAINFLARYIDTMNTFAGSEDEDGSEAEKIKTQREEFAKTDEGQQMTNELSRVNEELEGGGTDDGTGDET